MTNPKFNVTSTFSMWESSTCLGEMSEPLDTQEFFARLKAGFLQWRRERSAELMHSLTIVAPISERADVYRDLIKDVCLLWNSDLDIAQVGPTHIELALAYKWENWVGCTTAKNVIFKSGCEQGPMQFVDYALVHKDINQQMRTAKANEKARRRANPVTFPIELPANIKTEIARYLRLEYGESARDKSSLKARDLTFEGEFVIDGVPTQFWHYPSSNPKKTNWATVERFDDSYCLGMTDKLPVKK